MEKRDGSIGENNQSLQKVCCKDCRVSFVYSGIGNSCHFINSGEDNSSLSIHPCDNCIHMPQFSEGMHLLLFPELMNTFLPLVFVSLGKSTYQLYFVFVQLILSDHSLNLPSGDIYSICLL